MAKHAATFERIRRVIVRAIDCEPTAVTPEATLEADLGFDSLDRIEVVMDLEGAFQIELSDDDAFTWETVGDLVAAVKKAGAL